MKPLKYTKRPITIEAVQFDGTAAEAVNIVDWVKKNGGQASWSLGAKGISCVGVRTLEGIMRADEGDWIIKGVAGEFYPCKPDIFAQTYIEGEIGDT